MTLSCANCAYCVSLTFCLRLINWLRTLCACCAYLVVLTVAYRVVLTVADLRRASKQTVVSSSSCGVGRGPRLPRSLEQNCSTSSPSVAVLPCFAFSVYVLSCFVTNSVCAVFILCRLTKTCNTHVLTLYLSGTSSTYQPDFPPTLIQS